MCPYVLYDTKNEIMNLIFTGSARPVSTGSDSPDFGHDASSLGESINSMFEVGLICEQS